MTIKNNLRTILEARDNEVAESEILFDPDVQKALDRINKGASSSYIDAPLGKEKEKE